MSEYFKMFIDGTQMIFNRNTISIKRNKTLNVKKELRISKANMRKSAMQRSMDRLNKIKIEALA